MGLSSDRGRMADRYDVVVVGSGYGASVCAARLAPHARVCVLERGREYASGDFPSTPDDILKEAQFRDGLGHQGSELGLFDFHLNRDVDVLVGCGLGGTSLINGGIAIEPDPRVFERAPWPAEISWNVLAPYAARARAVLRPSEYPADRPTPKKLAALQQAAAPIREATFGRVAVNVHFGAAGETAPGVVQSSCNDCGDCVTGCNFEAKNTLPYTYLPLARASGAEIFTQCEVLYLAREDGGYRVHVRLLESGATPPVERSVFARAVVVGAGVLGSTGLLLRSGCAGFEFSNQLGRHFSTNGDALTIGYNCDDRTDALGFGHAARSGPVDQVVGATLLGVVDARAGRPLDEGVILEDGAFPSGLVKLVLPVMQLAASCASETHGGVLHWLRERQREALDLEGRGGADGAGNHSMLYLSMGHDGSAGELSLNGAGNVRIDWPTLKNAACFTIADAIAKELTTTLGGMHLEDPLYSNPIDKALITVHPLGGCAMASTLEQGVVDHYGRVFDRQRGGVHPYLYVADGSVIPTSLGVNPLLTISAISERIAENIQRELGG